ARFEQRDRGLVRNGLRLGGPCTRGGGLAVRARGTGCRPPPAPGYLCSVRHGLRRPPFGRSALTPAASGARPAAAPIVPHHAAMWPAMLSWAPSSAGESWTGDQEARSSNPVARGSARLAPNPSVTTRVTVPLGSA